jgi:hypothetical protein
MPVAACAIRLFASLVAAFQVLVLAVSSAPVPPGSLSGVVPLLALPLAAKV